MAGDNLRIRDFIYLDVERVKSIFSQIEEGLLLETAEAREFEKGGDAGADIAIPMIGEVGGKWQVIWSRQHTETRTLHDHIYNYTEERLRQAEKVLVIAKDVAGSRDTLVGPQRDSVPPTAFVLVKGQAVLNNYVYLERVMGNFNQLAEFIGSAAEHEDIERLPRGQQKEALAKAKAKLRIPEWQLKGLLNFIEVFYKGRLILKLVPFPDDPNIRVVCNLDTGCLRDDAESILFKYGTAPVAAWTLFGQIASVPPEGYKPFSLKDVLGGQIDQALEKTFESLRGMEQMALSVGYPEIAVTPVAVYRE